MPIVPSKNLEALIFCEAHTALFLAQAANIGLSSAQATSFKNAVVAGRAAWDARQNAIEAARVATVAMDDALGAMRRSAGDTIRLIKAFAETQSNPNTVYNIAQIPPPATPSPAGPPGTPTAFKVGLNGDGSITLRWKCVNPVGTAGTVYNVSRRIANQTAFSPLGAVGVREFTDATIPVSAASSGGVVYRVQAQRAGDFGEPSEQILVQFGAGGGSLTLTTASESPTIFTEAA